MATPSAKLRHPIIGLAIACLAATANIAHAAELTMLSPQAMKPALSDLIPQFERSTGSKVTVYFASSSVLVREIGDGKVADVAILSSQQMQQLQDDGKIVEGSLTPIAKLEYGLFVRKDAPKPDMNTIHKLKQTLLGAKSIALGDPTSSTTGSYFANLIERLQIADAIKPKIKTYSSGTAAIEAVADSKADLGVWVINGASGPGIDLAGVLPAQAKKSNAYSIGILTTTNQMQAAKALSSFISSTNSLSVMRSKGFNAP